MVVFMSVILLIVANFLIKRIESISCKNLQNQSVDWFVLYKSPGISRSPIKLVKKGIGFFYLDPLTQGRWVMPTEVGVDSDRQPMGYTLSQIYASKVASKLNWNNESSSSFHIMYNDEWPSGIPNRRRNSILGHCKGDIMFDMESGFWLIHSIPKFPATNSYEYPKTGLKFGQTALCVTFPFDQLSSIVDQLLLYQPAIFSSNFPTNFLNIIPAMKNLTNLRYKRQMPFNQLHELRSSNGVKFMNFAKHKQWNKELYMDFVAPVLQSSLLVESWQNGGGDLPSNCSASYTVNNVDIVQIDTKVRFRDTSDHSKWAVGLDSKKFICVGDINRQEGQLKRSGGTMCFKDDLVWNAFHSSIEKVQDCPS